MQNQTPEDNQTEPDTVKEVASNLKTLLIAISGVAAFLAIMVLLPMLLTYISEGDPRAPAASHLTDSARKSAPNSNNPLKPEY